MNKFLYNYLFLLVFSFYIRLVSYMVSYEVQRKHKDCRRFTMVDNNLGLWRYVVLSPPHIKNSSKVFAITADGEKLSVLLFIFDMVLIPFVSILVSQSWHLIIYIIIQTTVFVIITSSIYRISHRILALNDKRYLSESMLDEYIKKYFRVYRKEYPETEYKFDRIIVKKQRIWETITTISVRISKMDGTLIREDILAIKKNSKYYTDCEIILL